MRRDGCVLSSSCGTTVGTTCGSVWNATMTKPIKVGHLKANRLTVYKRADGTFFWNDRRSRKEVHGNRLWTTLEGVQMRGSRPDARQLPLESQDEDEDEDGDIVVQMSA